jgi:hypothetical protein
MGYYLNRLNMKNPLLLLLSILLLAICIREPEVTTSADHHSVLQISGEGEYYIVYHRRLPEEPIITTELSVSKSLSLILTVESNRFKLASKGFLHEHCNVLPYTTSFNSIFSSS